MDLQSFCFLTSTKMNLSKLKVWQSMKRLFCDYKVCEVLLIYSATVHLTAS